jgi:hypothetical protein
MESLSTLEQLRLKNLRGLHARPGGFGGPTSDYLVSFLNENGVSLTNTELTHIYQGKKAVSEYRAKAIERAFGLASGWLSVDHEFLCKLAPGEVLAHAKLTALPAEVKQRLYALVEALASVNQAAGK